MEAERPTVNTLSQPKGKIPMSHAERPLHFRQNIMDAKEQMKLDKTDYENLLVKRQTWEELSDDNEKKYTDREYIMFAKSIRFITNAAVANEDRAKYTEDKLTSDVIREIEEGERWEKVLDRLFELEQKMEEQ